VAFRQHHGIEDAVPPFLLIPQPLDLRSASGGDVDALIAEIKDRVVEVGAPLVAIVIDTLNRSFGGGNENSPEDMGSFIANVDRIGAETGAARIIIHHTGKDAAKGSRGHNSLLAATDAVLLVEKSDTGHTFTIDRMKDGDADDRFGFRLEPVELGEDEDGDAITSLVVEPDEAPPPARAKPISRRQRQGLQALADVIATAGQPSPACSYIPATAAVVPLDAWKAMCTSRGLLNGANPRQQFRELKTGLREAGRIGIHEPHVWIVKQ
jgi:hypothetical protein